MFLAGVAGIAWWLAKDLRRALVVFAFPIAYYIVAGSGRTVFARYMLPDLPFLCLGAGFACVRFVERFTADSAPSRRQAAVVSLAVLLVLPTAVKTVEVDRLLSRTDSRVVVADALEAMLPKEATIYHSGSNFGKIQWPATLDLREIEWNGEAGRFDGPLPEWILIQRSPLPQFSDVPVAMPRLLDEHYRLAKTFPAGADRPRVYDWQDAFFLYAKND
jgi:hypothetical protein